jgi:hypothetical protein
MMARVMELERIGPKKTRCGVCGGGLDPDSTNYRVREMNSNVQVVRVWLAHEGCKDGNPTMGR